MRLMFPDIADDVISFTMTMNDNDDKKLITNAVKLSYILNFCKNLICYFTGEYDTDIVFLASDKRRHLLSDSIRYKTFIFDGSENNRIITAI